MTVSVPFELIHLINIMVMGTLLLLAYGMGVTHSMLAPIFFFVIALVFLGVLDVNAKLWNPFGEDKVDLPLNLWAQEFLKGLAAMLDYEHDGASNGWEMELQEEKTHHTKLRLALDMHQVTALLTSAQLPAESTVRARSVRFESPVAAHAFPVTGLYTGAPAYPAAHHLHAPDAHAGVAAAHSLPAREPNTLVSHHHPQAPPDPQLHVPPLQFQPEAGDPEAPLHSAPVPGLQDKVEGDANAMSRAVQWALMSSGTFGETVRQQFRRS